MDGLVKEVGVLSEDGVTKIEISPSIQFQPCFEIILTKHRKILPSSITKSQPPQNQLVVGFHF